MTSYIGTENILSHTPEVQKNAALVTFIAQQEKEIKDKRAAERDKLLQRLRQLAGPRSLGFYKNWSTADLRQRVEAASETKRQSLLEELGALSGFRPEGWYDAWSMEDLEQRLAAAQAQDDPPEGTEVPCSLFSCVFFNDIVGCRFQRMTKREKFSNYLAQRLSWKLIKLLQKDACSGRRAMSPTCARG